MGICEHMYAECTDQNVQDAPTLYKMCKGRYSTSTEGHPQGEWAQTYVKVAFKTLYGPDGRNKGWARLLRQ